MRIEYSSTNSGGSFWLKDKDWIALKDAGWILHDYDYEVKKQKEHEKTEEYKNQTYKFNLLLFWDKKPKRYMGSIATKAHKDFPSVKDAILEFEKLTGQDASAEGCNCCGAPHTFYWGRAADDSLPETEEYGYASGDSVLEILHGEKAQKTKRELLEEKSK